MNAHMRGWVARCFPTADYSNEKGRHKRHTLKMAWTVKNAIKNNRKPPIRSSNLQGQQEMGLSVDFLSEETN